MDQEMRRLVVLLRRAKTDRQFFRELLEALTEGVKRDDPIISDLVSLAYRSTEFADEFERRVVNAQKFHYREWCASIRCEALDTTENHVDFEMFVEEGALACPFDEHVIESSEAPEDMWMTVREHILGAVDPGYPFACGECGTVYRDKTDTVSCCVEDEEEES